MSFRSFLSDFQIAFERSFKQRAPSTLSRPLPGGSGGTMRQIIAVIVLLFCGTTETLHAGEWVEQFQYGPFIFRSEFHLGGPTGVVREVVQLKADIEKTLKIKVGDKPIEINLFKDRLSYDRFIRARIPEGAGRRALYVKAPDRGRLYAYRSHELPVDLRHECTHALLHNALPFIPIWLDEGIAEYFEIPANHRMKPERMKKFRFRWKWAPTLAPLEAKRELTHMGAEDYLQAWAWVHFMLHESEQTRSVLLRYLNRIQQSDPPGKFSRHVSAGVPNAQARVKRHFRRIF